MYTSRIPLEEKKELIQKIDDLRAQGSSLKEACKKLGIVKWHNYYNYRDQLGLSKSKRAKKKIQMTVLPQTSLVQAPERALGSSQVMVILGSAREVLSIVQELRS